MCESRRSGVEQSSQQGLPRCRGKKIRAPNHLGHSHPQIIHDYGKLIGGHAIAAPQDEITDLSRHLLLNLPLPPVDDGHRTRGYRQTNRRRTAKVPAAHSKGTAAARVDRIALARMRCADLVRNFPSGTVAVVEKPLCLEVGESSIVELARLGLHMRRGRPTRIGAFIPIQTQPAKICHLLGRGSGHHARLIEVFETKHQSAAHLSGGQPRDQRRGETAQMQRSGGGRSKAADIISHCMAVLQQRRSGSYDTFMGSYPEGHRAFDLSGKTAVITGGSRGLGREMTLAFAAHGANVVIASRKLDACKALAKEVQEKTGREALPVAAHVGNWQECDQLATTALHHFGKIDILVNNAGMSPLYASLPEVSEALWDKVIAVNIKGPFRLSSLFGSAMVESGGGTIINISSIAAIAPTASEVPYGIAKAGLNNMTASLSRTFAPSVRVNCLMPGPFLTDISAAWPEEAHEHFRKTIPLQRAGNPDEIVGAALYLASDLSSYTTGAVIKIDGGSTHAPA